ncbi:DNA polymerase family A protein [Nocardia aurantiaca]|uniref:Uncharacterized protein n=1 Tax=Nocardia aurantiaca TaxID=2675850 RepID=A0A6I3KVK1_9NOCA|nr:hypothetical protein [Nocardia aurantiaca]MTE12094.1 hypothetical protein [Nocardia aurantiaca]
MDAGAVTGNLDDLGAERRRQLLDTAAQFRAAACRTIGRPVDLDSESDLRTVLFDELGLPPTPGHATDTTALYVLRDEHPHSFLTYLLAYRAIRAIGGAITL